MTSLSSHRDVMPTSDEPAVPRCIRPGPKTPALGRLLRRPDLLERRPPVGGALPPHEPGGIGSLEAEVHLEPAVVAVAGVRAPAALESVDAEPGPQMRRPHGLPVSRGRPPPPERHGALDVRNAHLREHPAFCRRPRDAHEPLPPPGDPLVA